MPSRKKILEKLEQFFVNVQSKIKNENTLLQVDSEFQQVKVKYLNDKYNVTMFTSSLSGRKAWRQNKKSEN